MNHHKTTGIRIAAGVLAVVLVFFAGVALGQSTSGALGEVTLFGEEEFKIQAATKTEVPLSKAPGSVTVISAKQIRESGARTIPELLRVVAGVNVRWNPMVQTVDMRSFGQNPFTSRVLLLIDGVPYNSWNKGGFPQHPGFDFFSLQNVKRIEVLRGAGSALYGENAFWGVINIVTLSGEDLEGGKIELTGGDLETRSAGIVYGKKIGEHGSFLASGKFLQSQFPTAFWYEENNSEVEGTDFYLKAKYKGLEVSYYRHEDKTDGFEEPLPVPGLPPGSFKSIESIEQVVDIYALKYNRKSKNGAYSFGSDVSFAKRDGSHCGACHAAAQSEDFQDTKEDHGFQLIGDFRFGIHAPKNHDILIGVEAREIDAGDHANELADPAVLGDSVVLSYTKIAAYFQDQISLLNDDLNITLGVRFDGSNDLFDEEVSPRVAVVYSATDALVLRAGWSQAFRFPNFSELYQNSWFISVDTGPFAIPLAAFVPNPDLQPEGIETWEAGLQYRISPSLSAKLDFFYSEISDFMVVVFGNVPPGQTIPIKIENHPDEATLWGTELEFRWSQKKGFTGFVNWSYQQADQKGNLVDSSGKPLEFVYAPENKLNLGFYFGPFAGFSGALDIQWRDDTTAPSIWNLIVNGDPSGEAELDGYTDMNIRLSYDLPWQGGGRQPSRLSLYGRNILDEQRIETLVGIDTTTVGRHFYGAFEFTF